VHSHNVHKNLAAAILLVVRAINPFQVQGHIAAVADAEHPSVHHFQIVRMAVGRIQYHAVGHTDVIGAPRLQLAGNSALYGFVVEFVTNVEICLHSQNVLIS